MLSFEVILFHHDSVYIENISLHLPAYRKFDQAVETRPKPSSPHIHLIYSHANIQLNNISITENIDNRTKFEKNPYIKKTLQ